VRFSFVLHIGAGTRQAASMREAVALLLIGYLGGDRSADVHCDRLSVLCGYGVEVGRLQIDGDVVFDGQRPADAEVAGARPVEDAQYSVVVGNRSHRPGLVRLARVTRVSVGMVMVGAG
jgi:hypothetical protein